jgi:uroporphyrinogen-III synthase
MTGRQILLLRHQKASKKTAASLTKRGYSAVILPLSEVKLLSADMPQSKFDGVIFTSPLAPQILHSNILIPGIADLPVYCVGEYTARCAGEAGFSNIEKVEKDARTLGYFVGKQKWINRILYPCGKNRSFDFESHLNTSNIQCVKWEVYANELIFPKRIRIKDALDATDTVFLFSKRTASHFFDVACGNANPEKDQINLSKHIFIAISENVAASVPRKFQPNTYIADNKSERGLIECLSTIDG